MRRPEIEEKVLCVLQEIEKAGIYRLGPDLLEWVAEEAGATVEELRDMGIRPNMPIEEAIRAVGGKG